MTPAPHVSFLTANLWLMEPSALDALAQRLSVPPVRAIAPGAPVDQSSEGYQVVDGIAHIPITGTLMQTVPDWFAWYGEAGTSYLAVAAAIRDAAADENVAMIMLDVDSPGGVADGVHALADCIAACEKDIRAHVDTLGASAAYWLASQVDELTAGRGSRVGSIGAYTVRVDVSRAALNEGVKVHTISSGTHKGVGIPGTAITDEQLAEIQRGISDLAAVFVADVAKGRGISSNEIQPSADGRVFSAADALQRGLIDRITSDPSKDYLMATATDAAKREAYLKATMALCAEHPAHAASILASSEKDLAIEQIRADIAVADKAAQESKAKADLEARITAMTAALDAEKAAHDATKTAMANVQRERDALASLKNGADAANKVKSEPVPKSVKKMTQAAYDKLSLEEKVIKGNEMASGTLIVEG